MKSKPTSDLVNTAVLALIQLTDDKNLKRNLVARLLDKAFYTTIKIQNDSLQLL